MSIIGSILNAFRIDLHTRTEWAGEYIAGSDIYSGDMPLFGMRRTDR